MIHRKIGLACLAMAIAALVSACGGSSGGSNTSGSGSNGIASKSAHQILAETKAATQGLKSVHIYGTVNEGSKNVGLNLQLTGNAAGKGTMSLDGLKLNLVNVNGTFYMSADSAFWTHFTQSPAAAKILANKWIKAPATGTFAAFEKFLNIHTLFNKAVSTTHKLTVIKEHSLNGQQVVGLHDASKNATLYVAATGKPYPVEATNKGTNTGTLYFNKFNQPVSISAPKGAVSLSQLEAQASGSAG
jgi:hypothetical protein